MLTSTIARCTPCVERARRAHSSTLNVISHFIGSSTGSSHNHLHTIHGAPSLIRFSSSTSTCPSLSFSFYFFHSELYSELDNLIAMQNLRYSANKGSDDAYDVSASLTPSEARRHRRAVAHVVCMAQDRPDLDVAACTLSTTMARPRKGDEVLVKRVCRCIKGRPRCRRGSGVGGADRQWLGDMQSHSNVQLGRLAVSWYPPSLVSGPGSCRAHYWKSRTSHPRVVDFKRCM